MTVRVLCCLFVIGIGISDLVEASESISPGFVNHGRDVTHNEPVDVTVYPWSAIGKLFNEAGGACTAVAIEHSKVVTAAHCIFSERTQRYIAPSSLHFMLGYERGSTVHHARVAYYDIGIGYDPHRWGQTLGHDWVILTLTEKLPSGIQPLKLRQRPVPAGATATIVGYPQDRAHMMTADRNCKISRQNGKNGLLWHTCRGAPGYSGAPILVGEGRDLAIAGIHIASVGRGDIGMLAISAHTIAPRDPTRLAETISIENTWLE